MKDRAQERIARALPHRGFKAAAIVTGDAKHRKGRPMVANLGRGKAELGQVYAVRADDRGEIRPSVHRQRAAGVAGDRAQLVSPSHDLPIGRPFGSKLHAQQTGRAPFEGAPNRSDRTVRVVWVRDDPDPRKALGHLDGLRNGRLDRSR